MLPLVQLRTFSVDTMCVNKSEVTIFIIKTFLCLTNNFLGFKVCFKLLIIHYFSFWCQVEIFQTDTLKENIMFTPRKEEKSVLKYMIFLKSLEKV